VNVINLFRKPNESDYLIIYDPGTPEGDATALTVGIKLPKGTIFFDVTGKTLDEAVEEIKQHFIKVRVLVDESYIREKCKIIADLTEIEQQLRAIWKEMRAKGFVIDDGKVIDFKKKLNLE